MKVHDGFLTINAENAEKRVVEIVKAVGNRVKIKSLNIRKPSLEDVFLYFTGKTIREEEATGKDRMRIRRRARGGR